MNKPTDEELIQRFLATAGIPVDPMLPEHWDCTMNGDRPKCHWLLMDKPYIQTITRFGNDPDCVQYEVRKFDALCWDRSTWYGSFRTLDEATAKAGSLVK
jgi:hypothetical protein